MKSYNKTVIALNFRRHKDLSTLKSDIHLSLGELSLFRVDKSFYTTLANLRTKYLNICKVYTDVGGIK